MLVQNPMDKASQESVGSLLADAQRVRSAAAAGPRPESSAQGSPALPRPARPVSFDATQSMQQDTQLSDHTVPRAGHHPARSSQLEQWAGLVGSGQQA